MSSVLAGDTRTVPGVLIREGRGLQFLFPELNRPGARETMESGWARRLDDDGGDAGNRHQDNCHCRGSYRSGRARVMRRVEDPRQKGREAGSTG